jgi:hypothetical protein
LVSVYHMLTKLAFNIVKGDFHVLCRFI